MRPRSFFVVALVAVLAGLAAADDEKALPFDPLATMAAGDWAYYTRSFERKRDGKPGHPHESHLKVSVAGLTEEGGATVSLWLSSEREAEKRDLSKPVGTRDIIAALMGERGDKKKKGRFEAKETKDETRKVGGRDFACTKVAGEWRAGERTYAVTLWLSKDAKALGLVAAEVEGGYAGETKVALALVGQGSGEKASWGEAPAKNAFGRDMDCMLSAAGSPAPAVTGLDAKGEKASVDLSQGPVLVFFYSTWNDCKFEVEWLQAVEKAFGPAGLKVVGVASVPKDDLAAWAAYCEKVGAKWTNLADTDGATGKAWNLTRKEVGSHASACMLYVAAKGKLAGGDFCVAEELWNISLSTAQGLKALMKKVKVPDDLKACFGEE